MKTNALLCWIHRLGPKDDIAFLHDPFEFYQRNFENPTFHSLCNLSRIKDYCMIIHEYLGLLESSKEELWQPFILHILPLLLLPQCHFLCVMKKRSCLKLQLESYRKTNTRHGSFQLVTYFIVARLWLYYGDQHRVWKLSCMESNGSDGGR